MKKILLSILLVVAVVCAAIAQPRAIGARIGNNIEFSYQHSILMDCMLDITAGATNVWNGWAYAEANIMLDKIFYLGSGDWALFAGGGIGAGYAYGYKWADNDYKPYRLNLGAQFGVEYSFKFPLTLSLDVRPMFNVLQFASQSNSARAEVYPMYYNFMNVALGVRYRFN